MTVREAFWSTLMEWYSENGRNYPWRGTTDPYLVLVAEVLLQQTNVRCVQPVYFEFISRYPSLEALAGSDSCEIMSIIRPLGLTYRAERLKKCAQTILTEYKCEVPKTEDELKKLPGVGDYISNAILCYAYHMPTVPVDTNVIRLFTRFFGLKSIKSRQRTDTSLIKNIKCMYDLSNTRIQNLSVLDFAAAICTASNPSCLTCPIGYLCSNVFKN